MPYTLAIPTTTISASDKPYTLYNITIHTPLRTQTIQKRYSDFVELNNALTSAIGAPPANIPAKSWFSRTINNPQFTEQRRKGLEDYLKAIEAAPDPKWRNHGLYKSFLGMAPPPTTEPKLHKSGTQQDEDNNTFEAKPTMSSQQWLDLHSQLKQYIQESRMCLTRRDQASTATQQHEASAQAKKWLVKAHTMILRLEEGLKGMKGHGDGELRRRRDLLTRARKEREALEGVCSAWTVNGSRDVASGYKNSSSSAAGNASTNGHGGAPAKETERTRELDNQGVLQLQQQVMQEQDMDVEDLTKVVRRMKEMGVAINEELVEQSQLLGMVDEDVDRVAGKIDVAKKRIRKIN
ncbi:hypothetical protein EJ08DRAFT_591937 [Tothia fuscella]|uniref:Phox-like protein n=1 Tax=Tothia fuscella TaxID=1048955 RepID=A0A9P4TXF1_9PEZI|nr:hypothetical protein EJ08DRAFT_591937 [Tothia fuscella]